MVQALAILDSEFGDNFADAIDTAREIYDLADQEQPIPPEKMNDFFLSVLFAMELPEAGAADRLIEFYQEKQKGGE